MQLPKPNHDVPKDSHPCICCAFRHKKFAV